MTTKQAADYLNQRVTVIAPSGYQVMAHVHSTNRDILVPWSGGHYYPDDSVFEGIAIESVDGQYSEARVIEIGHDALAKMQSADLYTVTGTLPAAGEHVRTQYGEELTAIRDAVLK
jgi:hypothetical protein